MKEFVACIHSFPFTPFHSPISLHCFEKIDFLSQYSDLKVSSNISSLPIIALTRSIYQRNIGEINALAAAVSVVGVYGELYSLSEGNVKIPESLIKDSNAEVRLNTKVSKIETSGDEFKISFTRF